MRRTGPKAKAVAVPRRLTIGQVARHFGLVRTYYYRLQKEQAAVQDQRAMVLVLVQRERAVQPRLGGKKLYALLRPELERLGLKLGRDKFLALLGEEGLLVERRRAGVRTTHSRHRLQRRENRLKDRVLTGPNQAWVSDVTYISTLAGFMYLSLIMDAYSRKILGWCLHDSLELEGCLKALHMALGTLPKGFDGATLLHHSDQGVQYCSHAYTALLEQRGIQISMAAVGDCYENAQAERLNGILKQEYGLHAVLPSKATARVVAAQAVHLYNERRPHLALQLHRPSQVHAGAPVEVRQGWRKKARPKVA